MNVDGWILIRKDFLITFLTWAWHYIFRISDTATYDCCYSGARIPLASVDTDVVIIAFNIMDRASFDNVKPVWFKEKKKDMKKSKVGNNSKGSNNLITHPL